MRCPECGQDRVKILETRDSGLVVRRRGRCDAGHRWTTVELPESVVKTFGASKLAAAVDRVSRGIEARVEAAHRRELAYELLNQGMTVRDVASILRITDTRVRQIRAERPIERPVKPPPKPNFGGGVFGHMAAVLSDGGETEGGDAS